MSQEGVVVTELAELAELAGAVWPGGLRVRGAQIALGPGLAIELGVGR